MLMNVCNQVTEPVSPGGRITLDCDMLATYLIIYMTDPNLLTSLVMCEVEVVVDEGKGLSIKKYTLNHNMCLK